jgi:hypothetical protein
MAVLRQIAAQKIDLKIPQSFYQEGASGEMEADVALNAPVVARLEEKGRAAFHAIIERQLVLHANDPVQYITGKAAGRRVQPWVARAVLVWMAGYQRHRAKRLASWIPPPAIELLCTPTTLPILNHESPTDLLPFFVQLGLLMLLQEMRNYGALGDSLAAIEASIIGALAKFQTKFILSHDNVAAAKGALATPESAGTATASAVAAKRNREGDNGPNPKPAKRPRINGLAKKLAEKKKELDGATASGAIEAGAKGPVDWVKKTPAKLKEHLKPPGQDGLYRKCCNPDCETKPPPFVVRDGTRRPFCKRCVPA